MKNYILIVALLCGLSACTDKLNVEPDFISETTIFEDEALTEAYLAGIYDKMQFAPRSALAQTNIGLYAAVGAEHINFANWQVANSAFLRTYSQETGGGPLKYWDYITIRELNNMIENIVNSQTFSPDYINKKLQEARFLRAYVYFEMVKRYGGVPIITKVQNEDDPQEELFPFRNTEKEVYDFIDSELTDVAALLSEERTGANGRIDRYTALALQSRAMLYAASIAEFGEVQLDGVVGIPAAEAQSYYQKSYNASKAIMDSELFSLYNESTDKVENYSNLFLTDGLLNTENIFAEVFEQQIKGYNIDYLGHPDGFNTVWNSNFPVLYDFVELYEWKDGRAPVSRSMLTTDNEWDASDFFGGRDPRFEASVFYPQTTWRDQEVYFHANTTYTDEFGEEITTGQGVINKDGVIWPAAGPARNVRNTALLRRKGLDPNLPLTEIKELAGGQDVMIFRYGEILLNRAEAAFYLTETDEALDLINQIRERAGMFARTEITEEFIRNERQIELAFENHRYWDLKRWRIAVDVIDGVNMQGLVFTYNLDSGLYTITLKNAETQVRSFGPERYYLPIDQDIISDNPNLVQNPGY